MTRSNLLQQNLYNWTRMSLNCLQRSQTSLLFQQAFPVSNSVLSPSRRFLSQYTSFSASNHHSSTPSNNANSVQHTRRSDPYVFGNNQQDQSSKQQQQQQSKTGEKQDSNSSQLNHKKNVNEHPVDEGGKILKDHNPSIIPGADDDSSIVTVAGMKAFKKLEAKLGTRERQSQEQEQSTTRKTGRHQKAASFASNQLNQNQNQNQSQRQRQDQHHKQSNSQPSSTSSTTNIPSSNSNYQPSNHYHQHSNLKSSIQHQNLRAHDVDYEQEKLPRMAITDIGHDSELLRTALRAFVNLEIKLKKDKLPSITNELKDLKPPAPVNPTECCGKECMRCVWVRYSDQLSSYEAAQQHFNHNKL